MKRLFIILILFSGLVSCEKAEDKEFPLTLPAAAEPSSKMYNDRGIEYYRKADYKEAVIAFVQARTADHTAGEIHFNLALSRLKLGDKEKAREDFKLAVKYSYDNPEILDSPLLNHHLNLKK
jgi:tetratricopeptide (TPR) repeat protein